MSKSSADEPRPERFDRFPYPSYAYAQTHPNHLATIAVLSGLDPAPVENCRVLEIGCASGGNLIPMAYTLPQSEFLGVDFSSRAIYAAQTTASDLGLVNVTFHRLNIMDVDEKLGLFDYIIIFGIYSWVPPEVQEKLLDICLRNLAPMGIAYINYNVYPGWHAYKGIRDLMLLHTRHTPWGAQRVRQGRDIIAALTETIPAGATLHGHILATTNHLLNNSGAGYVRHGFMAEINNPIYFRQFIERAQAHGLAYLANGELVRPGKVPEKVTEQMLLGPWQPPASWEPTAPSGPPDLSETPGLSEPSVLSEPPVPPAPPDPVLPSEASDQGSSGDPADIQELIDREQYLDFVRNQTFRQTLLCHQERSINREYDHGRLKDLYLTSRLEPGSKELDVTSREEVEFTGLDEVRVATAHPLSKALFLVLRESWPQAVPYESALEQAWQILEAATGGGLDLDPEKREHELQLLSSNLIQLYRENVDLIRLHTYQPHFVTEISEKPVVAPTARDQAQTDLYITNMFHQRVTVDRFPRWMIALLDGSLDRPALLKITAKAVKEGILEISQEGEPIEDPQSLASTLDDALEITLQQLAQAALLVG